VILVVKILFTCPSPYEFKHFHTIRFCILAAHSEQEAPGNVPVLLCIKL
jgi:hypothetical protein